jgi:hypothetical protein
VNHFDVFKGLEDWQGEVWDFLTRHLNVRTAKAAE